MNKFSLLLALRYLNPLRTHVSVITLISLAGVALGVMVLIVVLSIMDGFEGMVKERFLGHSPHLIFSRTQLWDVEDINGKQMSLESQWRDEQDKLLKQKHVINAYPFIEGSVLVVRNNTTEIMRMSGLDTENEKAVEEFEGLMVEGSAEDCVKNMGLGQVAVISSVFAEAYQIQAGEVIEVASNKNIKEIQPILEQRELTPLNEQFRDVLDNLSATVEAKITTENTREKMLWEEVQQIYNAIGSMKEADIRKGEKELLDELKLSFGAKEGMHDEQFNYYEIGRKAEILEQLNALKNLDVKDMDYEAFEKISLSREIQIVGVFQADRYTYTPDIYVPLNVARELHSDGEEGEVRRIAVTLKDPYRASQVLDGFDEDVTNGWVGETWMEMHKDQFGMISSQKSMMTIALSFIVLIAVFSIAAVMFTVTLQKKREIGVLKALGADQSKIASVFTLQGVIVGLFGALFGWLLSLFVLKNLKTIQDIFASVGFNPFPKSVLGSDTLPYIITPSQVLIICIGAFVLCSLAALVPAMIAARADAAKSLRNL